MGLDESQTIMTNGGSYYALDRENTPDRFVWLWPVWADMEEWPQGSEEEIKADRWLWPGQKGTHTQDQAVCNRSVFSSQAFHRLYSRVIILVILIYPDLLYFLWRILRSRAYCLATDGVGRVTDDGRQLLGDKVGTAGCLAIFEWVTKPQAKQLRHIAQWM